jgi:hypothetical protein
VRIKSYRRIMCDEVQEQIDQLCEPRTALINERNSLRTQGRAKVATPGIEDELKRVSATLHVLIEHHKTAKQERHNARRDQLTALNQRTQLRIKRGPPGGGLAGTVLGHIQRRLAVG